MSGSKSDNKYQWPASALGKPEMTILYDLRKELNMPINRVLAIEAARCLPLNGKLRVFVVDESDGLARDTQEALRHTLEHSGKTLFIFTANRKEEFIKPLLSRLTTFDFKELTPNDILKRLKAICDAEGLTGAIKPARLKLIVAKSEGDMRMAINELQKEAMLI